MSEDLEQKAREIANGKGLGCLDQFARYHLIVAITQALADVREADAKVCDKRAGALTLANCEGCGNEGDIAEGAANDEARGCAAAIRRQGGVKP